MKIVRRMAGMGGIGLLMLLFFPVAAHAQLTWDPENKLAASSGGNGVWSTSDSNWSNGTADVAWNNGAAIFGGDSGKVTLHDDLKATGLTFNNSAVYDLEGGSLDFGDSPVSLTYSGPGHAQVLIGTPLAGTKGMSVKQGAPLSDDTLISLNTANTFTGDVTIEGGTDKGRLMVQVTDSNALHGNPVTLTNATFYLKAPQTAETLDVEGSVLNFANENDLFQNLTGPERETTWGGDINLLASRDKMTDSFRSGSGIFNLNGNIGVSDDASFPSLTLALATGGNTPASRIVIGATGNVIRDGKVTKLSLYISRTTKSNDGVGVVEFKSANTYSGGTVIGNNAGGDGGNIGSTLVVNNTSGSGTGPGNVKVLWGTLAGTGTIGGPVSVGYPSVNNTQGAATVTAGNFPQGGEPTIDPGQQALNTLTFGDDLTLLTNGTLDCYLGAKSDKSGFTQLHLSGGTPTLTVAGATFTLHFANALPEPGSGDDFWKSAHAWTIVQVEGSNKISGTFATTNLGTYTAGSFSLDYAGGDGNDLVLNYTPGH